MTYLPRTESDQLIWMNNFASKLAVHAAAVDISAAQLAGLKGDVAFLTYVEHDLLPLYRAKAQEITSYKDLIKDGPLGTAGSALPVPPAPPAAPAAVVPGVLPRIAALVQRIKNAPGYNPAIGADLGIEGAAQREAASDDAKPQFKALALPGGQVRLDWVKGRFDGVRVEGRRDNESDWTHLGDDRYSPFNDERAALSPSTSETRAYRLRYLKKDAAVGAYSDTATVLTIP